jgi:PAS domain S-box-containing protein
MDEHADLGTNLGRIANPLALLRDLFAHAPMGLQIYDASGRSLLVNDAFRRLFRAVPPPDYNVFADEVAERSGAAPLIRRAFAGETVSVPATWYDPRELAHVRVTDGRRVAFESTFFPVTDDAGRVTHVAVAFRDVTDALRQEEKLRRLVDSNVIGVVFWEAEGRIEDANDAFLRLVGYERADLEGCRLCWTDLTPPEHGAAGEAALAELRARGASAPFEKEYLRKDGTRAPALVGAAAFDHDPGRGVAFALDLSARKRDEEALRLSEARFRTIVDHAPDAVLVCDADTHRLVEANPNAERLFGAPRAQLLALDPDVFQPPYQPDGRPSIPAVQECVRRCMEGQTPAFEWTFRTLTGRDLPCEVRLVRLPSNGANLCRASILDISERKKAEQALRASEQRFRLLVENSTDAIKLDDEDGTILYASPANERLLGYSPAELAGRRAVELVHPEDRSRFQAMWADCLARPGAPVTVELRYRHRDGRYRTVETTHVNRIDDPAIGAVVSNYHDVTARRQLEEQLRQAQKMEAIGRLAGGVAHDFNNLLTVILTNSFTLAGDMPSHDPRRMELEEIQRAAERAAELTRQLLAFSRQQVMQPRVLNLNDVVLDVERMLRRLIGEHIELTVRPSAVAARVRVDRSQIEQVIFNLAINARDAMPEGGKLTIETGEVQLDEEYARGHYNVTSGPHVMLAVTDTGVGMDRATQDRIFEPFFTTKEHGKGTGLGLSTVFGVVQQSGGHLWVYSEPGRGSTFKVYLPRCDEPNTPVTDRPAPAPFARTSRTLLLVEDDEMVRRVTVGVLRRAGYHVLEAANAGEALLLCEQYPGRIHLLLTDVVMPRMSGRQLASRLTAVRGEMKVLFMSGYTDNAIVHHGVLDAGLDFLQKPFTPVALLEKVGQILEQE